MRDMSDASWDRKRWIVKIRRFGMKRDFEKKDLELIENRPAVYRFCLKWSLSRKFMRWCHQSKRDRNRGRDVGLKYMSIFRSGYVRSRFGKRQPRFWTRDPPEWSMHKPTSFSISWPAGVVTVQPNLAFSLVAHRSDQCTTPPRFRSRDPPWPISLRIVRSVYSGLSARSHCPADHWFHTYAPSLPKHIINETHQQQNINWYGFVYFNKRTTNDATIFFSQLRRKKKWKK